jgi:hypothetical protein
LSSEHLAWLWRCEGFQVEYDGTCVGYVDEVRLGDDDQVQSLLVGGCRGLTRTFIVSPDEVASLEPDSERVLLGRYPKRPSLDTSARFADDLLRGASKWRRRNEEGDAAPLAKRAFRR